MILINKNSSNIVCLTLTEKTTITNPTYLFKFTNDLTRESILFIGLDTSLYTDRYNKFNIIETSGANDLLNSTVTLNPTGFFSYKIFEQASTTNLLESATGALIESGKVKVVGTDTTHTVYNSGVKKYKAYGKGSI
jgi:hypothetical protein